jgi:hypothetical protein
MNSKKISKSSSQRNLPPISLGITVIEDLPFPVVHYPPHYGSFIAFSEDYQSKPFLCACSRPAVENYLRLQNDSFNTSSTLSKLNL